MKHKFLIILTLILSSTLTGQTYMPNGARIGSKTSAPSNPKNGQLYYNSTDNLLYQYAGGKWKNISGYSINGSSNLEYTTSFNTIIGGSSNNTITGNTNRLSDSHSTAIFGSSNKLTKVSHSLIVGAKHYIKISPDNITSTKTGYLIPTSDGEGGSPGTTSLSYGNLIVGGNNHHHNTYGTSIGRGNWSSSRYNYTLGIHNKIHTPGAMAMGKYNINEGKYSVLVGETNRAYRVSPNWYASRGSGTSTSTQNPTVNSAAQTERSPYGGLVEEGAARYVFGAGYKNEIYSRYGMALGVGLKIQSAGEVGLGSYNALNHRMLHPTGVWDAAPLGYNGNKARFLTSNSEVSPSLTVGIGTSNTDRKTGLSVFKTGEVRAPSLDLGDVSTNIKNLVTLEYFLARIVSHSISIGSTLANLGFNYPNNATEIQIQNISTGDITTLSAPFNKASVSINSGVTNEFRIRSSPAVGISSTDNGTTYTPWSKKYEFFVEATPPDYPEIIITSFNPIANGFSMSWAWDKDPTEVDFIRMRVLEASLPPGETGGVQMYTLEKKEASPLTTLYGEINSTNDARAGSRYVSDSRGIYSGVYNGSIEITYKDGSVVNSNSNIDVRYDYKPKPYLTSAPSLGTYSATFSYILSSSLYRGVTPTAYMTITNLNTGITSTQTDSSSPVTASFPGAGRYRVSLQSKVLYPTSTNSLDFSESINFTYNVDGSGVVTEDI